MNYVYAKHLISASNLKLNMEIKPLQLSQQRHIEKSAASESAESERVKTNNPTRTLDEFVAQEAPGFFQETVVPLAQIRDVSAKHGHEADIQEAVSYVAREFEKIGFNVDIVSTSGNPIVYAEKMSNPDLKTILGYAHGDVQPANPDEWNKDGQKLDPWSPTLIGDVWYGRGIADDKGPIGAYLLAMKYLQEAVENKCNWKFVIEFNEESNKSVMSEFVKKYKDQLKCDLILICDSPTLVAGHPSLTNSLKGVEVAKLKTENPKELISLIHKSHDPVNNRVLLPGFYDHITEQHVPEEIQKIVEKSDPTEKLGKHLKPENGFSAVDHRWYRPTHSPLGLFYANQNPCEKEGTRTFKITAKGPEESLHSGDYGGPVQEPVLNLAHLLIGLQREGIFYDVDSMYYGSVSVSPSISPSGEVQITVPDYENINTAVQRIAEKYDLFPDLFTVEEISDRKAYLNDPKYNQEGFDKEHAVSYLSFRLVGGQNPADIYSSLEKLADNNNTEIEQIFSSPALTINTESKYISAVMRGQMRAYGKSEVHIKAVGGSLPDLDKLTALADTAVIGVTDPGCGEHGPNEHLSVDTFSNSVKQIVEISREMERV